MSDPILNTLRSANPSNRRFMIAVDEFRQKISVGSYRTLIQKIKRVRPIGLNTLIPPKIESISKISRISSLKSLSFEKEVAWTSLQLLEGVSKLAFHVECVEELAQSIGRADFIKALDVLDLHKKFYGETLWSIEATIGVLSRKDFSSEEVNDYLNARIEVHGSVADYLAYLFSDLFDEDTSLGGFHRRIGTRLKNLGRIDLKHFINIKAMSVDTVTCGTLSDFIRISSGFGLVDAYESLIKAVPQYFLCDLQVEYNGALLSALGSLCELNDPRMMQICNTLKYSLHFGERLDKAELWDTDCGHSHPDFKKIAFFALCSGERSESIKINSADISSIERQFIEILASFKNRKKELISTYEELQTLASKYYFLPWFSSAKSWIDGIFLPFSGELKYLLYRASTSCNATPYVTVESMIQCLPWMDVYEPSEYEYEIYAGNSLKLLTNNNSEVLDSEQHSDDLLRYGNHLLLLTSAINSKADGRLLKYCVQVAITNIGSSTFLPFPYIFEGRETWDDLVEFDSLDVTIGLYFASLWDRESRVRFLLEFACKKLLPSPEIGLSAEIVTSIKQGDPRVLFILREILVPKNLRLVGALRTAEDLEKFRIGVCATMLDVDREYTDKYINETMEILQVQDLRNAEKDLESARIYVDREGIKQWAEKTYREEFLRAKKARTTKMAPSIEEIEKNLSDNLYSKENKEHSSLAHNLKDPVFSIASEIFLKCFWKEDDGLDHFLSLRIRHGSFAGYLRAPLEQVHLIGTGSPVGGAVESYWSSSLLRSSEQSQTQFLYALESFQTSFDAIVEHFRTDLLQVSTESKPQGLFFPGLHKALWDAYHSDWEGALNFDKFFDLIWAAFQEALNSSLKIVVASIDEKVLYGSEQLLSTLRRTVNECGFDDTDRALVISALNDGVRSLQEAVKAVKKWFEVKRDPVSDTELSPKHVLELALKLFKKIRPNFTLEFNPDFGSSNVLFSGTNISLVTDALFIVFDNIYKHSGFDDAVKISLKFNWVENSPNTGFVNLVVNNPIHDGKDIGAIKLRLDGIRQTMNSGGNRVALVNEGLSGLIKLSWLASKGQHGGYVDFSIREDRMFCISLSMGFGFKPLI